MRRCAKRRRGFRPPRRARKRGTSMATSTPGRLSSAGVSKAKQLKQLEDGERQAERLLADVMLDDARRQAWGRRLILADRKTVAIDRVDGEMAPCAAACGNWPSNAGRRSWSRRGRTPADRSTSSTTRFRTGGASASSTGSTASPRTPGGNHRHLAPPPQGPLGSATPTSCADRPSARRRSRANREVRRTASGYLTIISTIED